MSKFICDGCDLSLGSRQALSRHKLHSCPNNMSKVPRKDILDRKIHKSNKHINIDDIPDTNNVSSLVKYSQQAIDSQNTNNALALVNPISTVSHSDMEPNGNMMDLFSALEKRLEEKFEKVKKPQCYNIDKIQIYLTDPVDFVDVLEKRMGSRKKAMDFVRSKVSKKIDGDVDLFCEIYLQGAPETWSIACPDKKNHIYHIIKPNGEGIISDPGGSEIYKIFKSNYTNTLLKISNAYIKETLNLKIDSPEYEKSRDELFDVFDLGSIQEKVCMLSTAPCNPFIKKLSVKFRMLEKSHEIAKEFQA